MLKVTIPAAEQYDPIKNEFIYTKEQVLVMEHSLLSLSKWESKWKKPFLSDKPKTEEESLDYFKCMTITQNVDPNIYKVMPREIVEEISKYIEDLHTATWFREDGNSRSKEILTSEVIYYAMFANGIDKECERWHLNRLLTLIRVFGEKNKEPKKMSKRQIYSQNRQLNAARRKRYHSKG